MLNIGHIKPSDAPSMSVTQENLPTPSSFDVGDDPVLDLIDLQQLDQYSHSGLGDANTELAPNGFFEQPSLFDDVNLLVSSESHDLTITHLNTRNDNSADNSRYLTRRRAPEPLMQQSANLVMEALCAIPEQMLRRVTLPPFIHPHWDRPSLPEPLAICMRIAQMFVTRTPDIEPFIWRTILAEQRRVVDQVCTSLSLHVSLTNCAAKAAKPLQA